MDEQLQQANKERRAVLESELVRIRAAKAEVEAKLTQMRGRPSKARAPAKGGIKRAGSSLTGPDDKRMRGEVDRERRMNQLWSTCNQILKKLKEHSCSGAFQVPVDPIKLKIPTYFNFVKEPISLQDISKKMENKPSRQQFRQYQTPLEFRDDVRLMFNNCRAFNVPGTPVHAQGETLSDNFERQWQSLRVEDRWLQERLLQQQEDAEQRGMGPNHAKQMEEMAAELRELTQKIDFDLARHQGPPDGRDMTFEEKRRLSVALGSLPGDRVGAVLDIIQELQPGLASSEEEVELDIDRLDARVLWRLQDYVSSLNLMGPVAKPAGSGTPARNGAAAARDDTTSAAQPAGGAPQQQRAGTPGRAAQADRAQAAAPAAAGGARQQQQEQQAPGRPAAVAADSTSSSSSDSDSDDEVLDDGADNAGATFGSGQQKPGAGGAGPGGTLLSSSHGAPAILKDTGVRKDTQIEDAAAWDELKEGGATEEGPGPEAQNDDLWVNFQNVNQQREQKKQEEAAAREAREKQKAEAEEAAKREAKEQARLRRESEEAAARAAEEARAKEAAEREAAAEEQRKADRARLEAEAQAAGRGVASELEMQRVMADAGRIGVSNPGFGDLDIMRRVDADASDEEDSDEDEAMPDAAPPQAAA